MTKGGFFQYQAKKKPLNLLTTEDDIAWKDSESSQHKVGRNVLGEALKSGKIMLEGKFVSQEAFEFMTWAMGGQKVEYEFFINKLQLNKLKIIRDEMSLFFDQDWNKYQQKEKSLTNRFARKASKSISVPILGKASWGVSYIGGGLLIIGGYSSGELSLCGIGGGLILSDLSARTIASKIKIIEILDEQKKEKLINLGTNYQNLKEIYDILRAEDLILSESIDETSLSNSSQLINGLQESITSNVEQAEINKSFSDLEGIWKEKVKVELNGVTGIFQTKIGHGEVGIDNQELQAVVVQNERTPLLPKK